MKTSLTHFKLFNIEEELHNLAEQKQIDLSLNRINKIAEHFNSPHNDLRVIHIAGTNGKGTTADFISQILERAGFRVGLYSSPHLISYRERFQINGVQIAEKKLVDIFSKVKNGIKEAEVKLTEFEILTMIAFLYFKEEKVDYLVLETGLGGRLDATNIVRPIATVITPIALDHESYLGFSIDEIAKEKAGIIKINVPVFSAKQEEIVKKVLLTVSQNKKADFFYFQKNYNNYLEYNKNFAKYVIEKLFPEIKKKTYSIDFKTRVGGRMQVISETPLLLMDGAHNLAGIKKLIGYLDDNGIDDVDIIYGAVEREHLKEIISTLANKANKLYLVEFDYFRSVKIERYEDIARDFSNIEIVGKKSLRELINNIHKNRERDIVITGSLYLLGELITKSPFLY